MRHQAAFKTIKGDLAIRPIFHQNIERIERTSSSRDPRRCISPATDEANFIEPLQFSQKRPKAA
jgi:hypothetical protein